MFYNKYLLFLQPKNITLGGEEQKNRKHRELKIKNKIVKVGGGY